MSLPKNLRFSRTVRRGYSAVFWAANPTRARARCGSVRMSCPSIVTVPESGVTRPTIDSSVVVFPAPLTPNNPTISPAATSKDTLSTAVTPPYRLTMSTTWSTALLLLRVFLCLGIRRRPGPRLSHRRGRVAVEGAEFSTLVEVGAPGTPELPAGGVGQRASADEDDVGRGVEVPAAGGHHALGTSPRRPTGRPGSRRRHGSRTPRPRR